MLRGAERAEEVVEEGAVVVVVVVVVGMEMGRGGQEEVLIMRRIRRVYLLTGREVGRFYLIIHLICVWILILVGLSGGVGALSVCTLD